MNRESFNWTFLVVPELVPITGSTQFFFAKGFKWYLTKAYGNTCDCLYRNRERVNRPVIYFYLLEDAPVVNRLKTWYFCRYSHRFTSFTDWFSCTCTVVGGTHASANKIVFFYNSLRQYQVSHIRIKIKISKLDWLIKLRKVA